MTDAYDEIFDLIDEANDLPYGTTRTALNERAVRLADAADDVEIGFDARIEFIESAVFGGEAEKAFAAFSWCAAKVDAFPDYFPDGGFDLLWTYKWIALSLSDFPSITLEQIQATLDEMKSRYEKFGISLRPYHMEWASIGIQIGKDRAFVREHFQKAMLLETDDLADCEACEQSAKVEYHLHNENDYDRALAEAKPLLEEKLTCAEVPHGTFGMLLLPTWDRGDLKQASAFATRGYEMCRTNPDFLQDIGFYLQYAAVTGDTKWGLEMLERHVGWWLDSRIPFSRVEFSIGATMVLKTIDTEHVSLRLPDRFPIQGEGRTWDVSELVTFFSTHVTETADAFDQRNGNKSFSDGVRDAFARLDRRPG